jgi:hypothetical protein
MSGEFQSVSTGVAAHIGKYADAVQIPAGAEVIYTSGTPGLRPDGTVPEDFTEEATQAWRNVEDALGRGCRTDRHRHRAAMADGRRRHSRLRQGTVIGDQTRTRVHACRDSGACVAQHPRGGRSHCDPTRHMTMDSFALATFEINSAISILRQDNQE